MRLVRYSPYIERQQARVEIDLIEGDDIHGVDTVVDENGSVHTELE